MPLTRFEEAVLHAIYRTRCHAIETKKLMGTKALRVAKRFNREFEHRDPTASDVLWSNHEH